MSFLRTYVEYAREVCHAPDIFHKFAGLVALAGCLGPRCRMPWGDGFIHPNLWLLFIAESSVAAKTTSMQIAARLMYRVSGANVFPAEFTREKLIELLQSHGHGTLFISEFSHFMGGLRRGYNEGAIGLLTDIYDVPTQYRRATMRGEMVLHRPCISILACSTPDYLASSEEEWMSGFGPRFLLIPGQADRFIPIPPPADREKREALQRFLANALTVEGLFRLEDDEMYRIWAKRHWESQLRKSSLERSWGSRMAIYAIKLAMLLTVEKMDLWRGPLVHSAALGPPVHTISKDVLREALQLVSWVEAQQMTVFHKTSVRRSPVSRRMEAFLDAVRTVAGDGWARRADVLRLVRVRAKEADELVRTLAEMGMLAIDCRKTGGRGRPSIWYKVLDGEPVDPEDKEEREAIKEEANGRSVALPAQGGDRVKRNGRPVRPAPVRVQEAPRTQQGIL